MKFSVSVVSDYEVIGDGVRSVLKRFPESIDLLAGGGEVDADVVLWSSFGVPRGVALEKFLSTKRARHLVVLCWNLDAAAVQRGLDAGASGYLSTQLSGEELLSCLRRVAAGEIVVSDAIDGAGSSGSVPRWPGQREGLSEREGDIVALIATGLSNQQIADQLFISVNTIKSYVRTAYQKMGVASRSQALLWAVQRDVRPSDRGHG